MIETAQTPEGWVSECTACGWRVRQEKHIPTRHHCDVEGVLTYVPPDWSTRSKEERALVRKQKIESLAPVDPRRNLKEPSLAVKGVNYTKAAVKHTAAGLRQATDEQVAERFAICQACPLFKPKGDGLGVCTHPSCGCSLKTVGLTGRNKLRWADSQCPLPEPRWLSLPAPPAEQGGDRQ